MTCNFDSGLCGWSQSLNNDFPWLRHNKASDSGGTGPPSDHTGGRINLVVVVVVGGGGYVVVVVVVVVVVIVVFGVDFVNLGALIRVSDSRNIYTCMWLALRRTQIHTTRSSL